MTSVGVITTFPSRGTPLGGVAVYARALVDALQEEASGPVVVLAQRHPPPEGHSAVPVWDFGWSFNASVRRSLDEHPVDLVHVQYEPFLFGKGAAALPVLRLPRVIQRRGIPCIMTLHAVPLPSLVQDSSRAPTAIRWLSLLYLRAVQWMGKGVDRFVVHEPEQAETLTRFARIPEDAISVIPHGVDVVQSVPRPPVERPFTIGTFGFLTPYKDPEYLLEEFCELRRRLPQALMRFSLSRHPRRRGQRSERQYRDIMRRARSIEGIEVLQHIPEEDLPAFLADCDLVVLSYKYPVSSSGVAATAIGSAVPVLVPEGSGTLARLAGWSFRYVPGGLAMALARQSGRLDIMHDQARTLASERSWQRVAYLHQHLYE